MTPEQLALIELLMSYGYSENEAIQMAASGAMQAPVPVRPYAEPTAIPGAGGQLGNVLGQMQQGFGTLNRPEGPGVQMGSNVPLTASLPPLRPPSAIVRRSLGVHPTSGFVGQGDGSGPSFGTPSPYDPAMSDSGLVEATMGMGDIQPWTADDNTGWYAPNASPPGPEYPYPDEGKDRRVSHRQDARDALMDMFGDMLLQGRDSQPSQTQSKDRRVPLQQRSDPTPQRSSSVDRMVNSAKSTPAKPSSSRGQQALQTSKNKAATNAADRVRQLSGR